MSFAESLPNGSNRRLDGRRSDRSTAPNIVQDIVPRHRLACVPKQIHEQIEGPRLQRNELAVPAEPTLSDIDVVGSKPELIGRAVHLGSTGEYRRIFWRFPDYPVTFSTATMQTIFRFIAALSPAIVAALAQASGPVKDVLDMIRAGISDDIIVAKLAKEANRAEITTDQLIELKKAGASDAVMRALLNPSAGIALVASVGGQAKIPPTGDPNDPNEVHESGIYLMVEKSGERQMVVLERAAYQGSKTGALGAVFTYGIVKAKSKAIIVGERAPLRTSNQTPTFYFYFAGNAGALGQSGLFNATQTNPNQFALVRLESKDGKRETVIATNGFASDSAGAEEKSLVTFKSERLRSGVYKVSVNAPIKPGEYAFIATVGAAGTAGAVDVFDSGINPAN